ncbi:MAG: STAS domain-containing protein [Gammaproteobacteria bacterium]|nr:STAS domain-containing protein [Gammaproteobacteria bacterium]
MSDLKLLRLAEGEFRLEGELSFKSVPILGDQEDVLFNSGDTVICDLSGIERSDSAGLALLMSWMRAAQHRGRSLRLRAMPAQLLSLVRVSGLEAVLPLE